MGGEMSGPRPDKSQLFYQQMPATWWLRKLSYLLFMLRELSSVFIAIFLIVFLFQIHQLSSGSESYIAFSQKLSAPGWIFFHIITLLFALYHSVTWFYSTSVVLPLRIGGWEAPRNLLTALNIGAWIVVSFIILFAFLTFNNS